MPTETTDLIIHTDSNMTDISVTANTVAAIPSMQQSVLDHCRSKLATMRTEAAEIAECLVIAIRNHYRHAPIKRQADLARRRVEFYEKVVAAMEAGYILFPPTECQVFAIRTSRNSVTYSGEGARWAGGVPDEKAMILPLGAGKYHNPEPTVQARYANVQKLEGGVEKTVTEVRHFAYDFDDVAFPVTMLKPEIMKSTQGAMALKIFDEVCVAPAGKRRDPVIVGRIIDPKDKWRRLDFLISWHINTKDI